MQRGGRRVLQFVARLLLPAFAGSFGWGQSSPAAAIQGIYRGAIGKQEIVLEIGLAGASISRAQVPGQPVVNQQVVNPQIVIQKISGRYFYRRYGVTILLEGKTFDDGSLRLQEYHIQEYYDQENNQAHSKHAPTGAELRLWFSGDNTHGFFCRCDAGGTKAAPPGSLNIALTRVWRGIDPGASAGDGTADKAYYNLLLDLTLRDAQEVQTEAGAYRMRTDKRVQKMKMPYQTRFHDAKVMERVNVGLAKRLEGDRAQADYCLAADNGSWEEEVRVAVFTKTLLSVEHDTFMSCGGPYPIGLVDAELYDMRAGRELDLKDFFKAQETSAVVHDGVVPEGPAHSLLLGLYKKHYVKPGLDPECDEDRINYVKTIRMYFDRKGVVILPELAHAIQGCGPDITIPYAELRPFLRQGLGL
jgi:hypothetical protein